MPTKQSFTVWGNDFDGINLSHSVGTTRTNETGDVMLVQALLNFIAEIFGLAKVGLQQDRDLPLVTGQWSAWFDVAIGAFQRQHSHLLVGEAWGQMFRVSKPFSVEGEERFPTIVLLNQFAYDATAQQRNQLIEATNGADSGSPYPTSLLIMFPRLKQELK